MIDILIKGATIIDGSGNPAYKGDVAIQNNKIVKIGEVNEPSKKTIDAQGLVLSPGFIDVHGHSDMFAFVDPDRSSKLCQGITTEICGQCGLGPAPVGSEYISQYTSYFRSQGAPIYPECNTFTTFGKYLDYMSTLSLGINMVYFIPHGTVRMAAMGLSPEKPTANQLEKMTELVDEGMKRGALGLSSGLMYAPGMFADSGELEALCKVVGQYGGIYTSHIRDQGNQLEECVAETIRIAESSGARANISHHKASGKNNWGKVKNTCSMIHNANIPVMHDVYPYAASSTVIRSTLPPNVQKMDQEDIITYLKDVGNHELLKKSIFNPDKNFESPLSSCGYDGILIFDATHTKDAIGKTIEQYADYLNIPQFDAFIKILTENSLGAGYIGFSMSEDDVETLVADSLCMFGTDGLYVPGMPMTHPRAIGTFPRILGRYVREKHVITLEEAIRKMTSLPAKFYGLENKGEINVGMDADIVLFDADTIIDHSDYQHPLLQNEGIHLVIVNGKIAVEHDKYLGIKNGRLLKARHGKGLFKNLTFSTKMRSFINIG